MKIAIISHVHLKEKRPLAPLIVNFLNPSKIKPNEIYEKLNYRQREYLASKHLSKEEVFVNVVKSGLRKVANWKMAIQWIHLTSIHAEHVKEDFFNLRNLYTNAIYPDFLNGYKIKNHVILNLNLKY